MLGSINKERHFFLINDMFKNLHSGLNMEYWVSFKYMHVPSILGGISSSPHALELPISILTDQEYPDHLHTCICIQN